MNCLSKVVIGLTLLSGSLMAAAQVYETRDAQGNPVFSDVPSPDAEVVDLPAPNVADSVEPPAADAGDQKTAAEKPKESMTAPPGTVDQGAGRVTVVGDTPTDNTPASGRNIGYAEPREQVLDAEPRREVLDAEPRQQVQTGAAR